MELIHEWPSERGLQGQELQNTWAFRGQEGEEKATVSKIVPLTKDGT